MFGKRNQLVMDGSKVAARYPDGWMLLDNGKDQPLRSRFAIADKSQVPTPLLEWVRTKNVQSPGGPPSEGFMGYVRCFLELQKEGDLSYLLRPEVAQLFAEYEEIIEKIDQGKARLRELEEVIKAGDQAEVTT